MDQLIIYVESCMEAVSVPSFLFLAWERDHGQFVLAMEQVLHKE